MASAEPDPEGDLHGQGATARVYRGIMLEIEVHRMVPGQRLIETELAQHYGVGRNAVREAIQRLAGRGIVDLSPNRSPSIRRLDRAEVHEILDVAASMTALVAATAALRFEHEPHAAMLEAAIAALEDHVRGVSPAAFSSARRNFYRAMLTIANNRELRRIFPLIGMHLIYSQFPSQDVRTTRLTDYRQIGQAISRGDPAAAERAARDHVEHVRALVEASGRFDD